MDDHVADLPFLKSENCRIASDAISLGDYAGIPVDYFCCAVVVAAAAAAAAQIASVQEVGVQ